MKIVNLVYELTHESTHDTLEKSFCNIYSYIHSSLSNVNYLQRFVNLVETVLQSMYLLYNIKNLSKLYTVDHM